jgi:hypothetical protein
VSTLPTDAFDKTLSRLTGLPDGAHMQPAVVQAMDFYGNVTSFMVQTVKWDEGPTVFVTQVNADGSARFVLPPKVLATIARQQDAVSTMIRRRHGKRLAESLRASGRQSGFTPEMRAQALATRRTKAARRRARKGAK